MIRALMVATIVVIVSRHATPVGATPPPPPPTPSGCHVCTGPPRPPTPVPTVAPTLVPIEQAVTVQLSPTHVARGHDAKIQVTASEHDNVTFVMRFHGGNPFTLKGKIGSSGVLVKSYRVPRSAPVGKATLKVTVQVRKAPPNFSTTVAFLVTN